MIGKVRVTSDHDPAVRRHDPTLETVENEYARVYAVIPKLTKIQRDAFSRICCGDDSCLNPRTAEALVRHGLIIYELKGGLYRADFLSYAAHMAWARWASEQTEGVV